MPKIKWFWEKGSDITLDELEQFLSRRELTLTVRRMNGAWTARLSDGQGAEVVGTSTDMQRAIVWALDVQLWNESKRE